jgi:hypothetical protein
VHSAGDHAPLSLISLSQPNARDGKEGVLAVGCITYPSALVAVVDL